MDDQKEVKEENTGKIKESDIGQNLEMCQKEKEEYLNGWKRAKADLLNYKKEEAKRLEEILKFATIEMIKDFIPILDSFDLALENLEKEGAANRGMQMIRLQLEDALKKKGLEKVEVKAGDKFDPAVHEGLGEIESAHPAGSVAEQIEKGYRLNRQILRPVRVKLSKKLE